jgi:DNA methylase
MIHSRVRISELNKRWQRAPRRWGHPMHSLCSYFAMFPPQVPHVFIRWLTQPGDVVYDPFAGRGTAPMEACRLGRLGVGSDVNQPSPKLPLPQCGVNSTLFMRGQPNQQPRPTAPGRGVHQGWGHVCKFAGLR